MRPILYKSKYFLRILETLSTVLDFLESNYTPEKFKIEIFKDFENSKVCQTFGLKVEICLDVV